MHKKKLSILNHRIKNKRFTNEFAHKGVLQWREKLQCSTPF